MEQDLILQQLGENAELIENGFALVESHLINIEAGLQIMIYVAIAFFVWAIIRVLYKLFGGVFFGGV